MGMSIRVQNDYDEVLQDTMRIAGSIEIWNRLDPAARAQYQLVREIFLEVSPNWVLTHGVLTLEPRGFASLGMSWGHYIRQPVVRPIWCGQALTPHINPSGEVYYVSDRILLGVKAKIQVFKAVALLSTNEVDAEVEYWIYPLPSSPPPDSTFCLQ
jgi:hypothetical protein